MKYSSLFAVAGFVGLSSELFSVPFECNFDESDTPASISALWIRLATPWMTLFALLLTFIFFWSILNARHERNMKRRHEYSRPVCFTRARFTTCLIVISIVSCYFSYIDVVRELLRAINCVEIGKEEDDIVATDHPYHNYSLEIGENRVWAEDTDLVCYEGKHLPTGIIGIVGIFIAFLGIVAIIVWLPLNKKNLTKTEFVSRYWFLYQAYRKEWYTIAWESTILTRKALIAAVIVFSVHLGPTLQASMCAGVLIVAHILHSTFSPFKIPEDHEYIPEYAGSIFRFLHMPKLSLNWIKFNNSIHLNILESASLASSVIVFYSAIILHDSNSSLLGRAAMTAFTFVVNVLFLLYMLYRLYCGLHVLLDLKLDWGDAGFMAQHENSMGVRSLLKKSFALVRVSRQMRSPSQNGHGSEAAQMEQALSQDLDGVADLG